MTKAPHFCLSSFEYWVVFLSVHIHNQALFSFPLNYLHFIFFFIFFTCCRLIGNPHCLFAYFSLTCLHLLSFIISLSFLQSPYVSSFSLSHTWQKLSCAILITVWLPEMAKTWTATPQTLNCMTTVQVLYCALHSLTIHHFLCILSLTSSLLCIYLPYPSHACWFVMFSGIIHTFILSCVSSIHMIIFFFPHLLSIHSLFLFFLLL